MPRKPLPPTHPPPAHFHLNRQSPQAVALIAWFPTLAQPATLLRDRARTHHLAPTNSPTLVHDPARGNALKLTLASEQCLTAAAPADALAPPLSLACWFLQGSAIHQGPILGVTAGFTGGVTTGSGFYLESYGDPGFPQFIAAQRNTATRVGAFSGSLTQNRWYHAVATFDSLSMRKIYIDGKLIGQDTDTTSTLPTLTTLRIGATSLSAIDGQIADARIYNRSLTPQEVWHLYDRPWDLYQPTKRRPAPIAIFPVKNSALRFRRKSLGTRTGTRQSE